MHDRLMELSIDELVDGQHEKCKHCRKKFTIEGGVFVRMKAYDGHFYCSRDCASAPYLVHQLREEYRGRA